MAVVFLWTPTRLASSKLDRLSIFWRIRILGTVSGTHSVVSFFIDCALADLSCGWRTRGFHFHYRNFRQ